ncbi:hypothetical protein M404DRAFT_1005325 [Pisolithus tinctorius Marx 270]|uniref:Uncharacterized protein n=1 Tax=Pisolithus tinctorius Marx 270 TaxID=870435 RepID=A0A0C3JLN4_PISTI|nr:hypothetical protein M404DRAFT_1005325 [Pisolithus tinctorius Marx 270]
MCTTLIGGDQSWWTSSKNRTHGPEEDASKTSHHGRCEHCVKCATRAMGTQGARWA